MNEDQSQYDESKLEAVVEQIVAQLRAGLPANLDEICSQNPDLADELRAIYPALQIVENVQRESAEVSHELIGDYQVVRKIGQGGMGIVYEAVQNSLGRRVALKTLNPSAVKQPKFEERFRVEARAAAKLHHTNIVPVFEVGKDGNVLYYAMQYIDGQTLDQVAREIRNLLEDESNEANSTLSKMLKTTASIRSRRASYCREIARLGAKIANALDYAHERSVLHRDIKPSNLILDRQGEIWLADFGLAKMEDAGLTETGDLLGTIQFMAPERFQGHTDARSDVYGLGMTLYELATLRRAFDFQDRVELIEQVKRTEPPAPTSIQPTIPIDLETIILKAIEKDPRRRYQSARELESDLSRFVDGLPITARRVSLAEKTIRWCQRNVAATVALVAMTIMIAVLGTSGWIIRNQRDLASKNLIEANRQAAIAEENFSVGFDAVRTYLEIVGANGLLNEPGRAQQQLREDLLESVTPLLERLIASKPESLNSRLIQIQAYQNRAATLNSRGEPRKSMSDFRTAIELVEQLPAWQGNQEALRLHSAIHVSLASILIAIGESDEALVAVEKARRSADQLVQIEDTIEHRLVLTSTIRQRIAIVAPQDLRTAESLAREALAIHSSDESAFLKSRPAVEELGLCHRILGAILAGRGSYRKAISCFQEAAKSFETAISLDPRSAQLKYFLANQYSSMAQMHNRVDEPELGLQSNRKAQEVLQVLVADYPNANRYRSDLANVFQSIGISFWKRKDFESALNYLHQALALRRALFQMNPAQIEYQVKLSRCLYNVALAEEKVEPKNFGRRVKLMEEAVELGEAVARADPKNARLWTDIARYQSGFADVLMEQKDWTKAEQTLVRCIDSVKSRFDGVDMTPEAFVAVAQAHASLGNLYLDGVKKTATALSTFRRGITVGRAGLEKVPDNGTLKRQFRRCLRGAGRASYVSSDFESAVKLFREAQAISDSFETSRQDEVAALRSQAMNGEFQAAASQFQQLPPEASSPVETARFWGGCWQGWKVANRGAESGDPGTHYLDHCCQSLERLKFDQMVELLDEPEFVNLRLHARIRQLLNQKQSTEND